MIPSKEATHPSWLHLMELWLRTHHWGQPAVIFSQPGDSMHGTKIALWVKTMQKNFGADFAKCIGMEFAVLPCSTLAEARKVMRSTPENNPFTLVWDGTTITDPYAHTGGDLFSHGLGPGDVPGHERHHLVSK